VLGAQARAENDGDTGNDAEETYISGIGEVMI
jgi:hypothetical protein